MLQTYHRGHMGYTKDRMALVPSRSVILHKCKGTFGSFSSTSVIRKLKKKYSNFDKNRHCNCEIAKSSSKTDLGLASNTLKFTGSRVYTRNMGTDWDSRNQQDPGDWMWEDKSFFSQIMKLWTSRLHHQLPRYVSWRPRGNMDECISSLLERNESLHVFSNYSDRQMSIKHKRKTNRICSTDHTTLVSSALVSYVRDVDSRPSSSSTIFQSVNMINRFNPSPNSKQLPIFSCMENVGESAKTNLFPKRLPLYTPTHEDQEQEQLTKRN